MKGSRSGGSEVEWGCLFAEKEKEIIGKAKIEGGVGGLIGWLRTGVDDEYHRRAENGESGHCCQHR